jgi:hypothetical protein
VQGCQHSRGSLEQCDPEGEEVISNAAFSRRGILLTGTEQR